MECKYSVGAYVGQKLIGLLCGYFDKDKLELVPPETKSFREDVGGFSQQDFLNNKEFLEKWKGISFHLIEVNFVKVKVTKKVAAKKK